ncbi:MAG TPA: thrombospondin type 3 repeat-containing protein, partial [Polyangia bacterium]
MAAGPRIRWGSRRRPGGAAAALALALGVLATATAQAQRPYMEGELGQRGLVTLPLPTTLGERVYTFGLHSGYLWEHGQSSWRVDGVSAGFGVSRRLDLSAAIGLDRAWQRDLPAGWTGQVAAKMILREQTEVLPAVGATLAIGHTPVVTLDPRLLLEKTFLRDRLVVGAGGGMRGAVDGARVGALVGGGVGFANNGRWVVAAEVQGLTGAGPENRGRAAGAFGLRLGELVTVYVGGGYGWGADAGARVTVSLVVGTAGQRDKDSDGDGIPDRLDKCPFEPEDYDGFQDDDGCPDPDNDGDGIPDALDPTPNGEPPEVATGPAFSHPRPRLRLGVPIRPIPVGVLLGALPLPPPSPKHEDLDADEAAASAPAPAVAVAP